MKSSFTAPIILVDNNDGETFTLHKGFSYRIGSLDNDIVINVPEGFITDLGSIPRFATLIVPKIGKYNASCVMHDFLYEKVREGKFSRVIADAIFLESMGVLGVRLTQRWLIYLMVRIFGHFAVKSKGIQKNKN